jgi:hypothetical protein
MTGFAELEAFVDVCDFPEMTDAHEGFILFIKALFSSSKILQNFSDSPSHRIFRRMHGVLNIDKNKN